MSLPNPSMDFTALDTLSASSLDQLVENIESLSDGSGLEDLAITETKLGAGAVTNGKIANSVITNTKLSTDTGEIAGAWDSWTPTYNNFTKGSASVVAKYQQVGKTVRFSVQIALSGSTMGTAPTISLPVAADTTQIFVVNAYAFDSGTTRYPLLAFLGTTTTIDLFAMSTASSYVKQSSITSTAPMTWADNDTIYVTGFYQAL